MYSETVLAHFANPHHLGALEGADAVGQAGAPGEGPHMSVFLKMAEAQIAEAWYITYGCPAMIACGSWLTRWAEGKSLEQAGSIEAEELALVLGGLPLGKEHAAQLSVQALRRALAQLLANAPGV